MNNLQEDLAERYDADLLFMDGYDSALCGVVSRIGQEPITCYDMDKVIKISMTMGMTEEEAIEHFEYNQIGGWVGSRTPCFIETLEDIRG